MAQILDKNAKWIGSLSEEDSAFLKRFVLASGSLKDLASSYGISYPTVRLRLDRIIEKIKIYDSQIIETEFEKLTRSLYVEGKIDMTTMKTLLAAHQSENQKSDTHQSNTH